MLPVLLLTVAAGALAGLAALPSVGAADRGPDRVVTVEVAAVRLPLPLVLSDRDLDRASRSRPVPSRAAARAVAAPSPAAAVARAPGPRPAKIRLRAPARDAATRSSRAQAAAIRAAAGQDAPVRSGGRCPVPSATFTDTYGAPRPGGRTHKGTDLLASYGDPVYAVADGVVDATSSSNGGISLYLRASNGERYFYAHNSRNVAADGEQVQAGELIARVGSTGNAGDIDHVHFEREVGGVSVDPYRFLRGLC